MKVVAFNGSPRKDGNCVRLIHHVFTALNAEGIETEMVQLGGNLIHGCKACYQCFERKDGRCVVAADMVNDCLAKMRQADGILFASPTYFADITPELKALIDRAGFVALANGGRFARKIGAAVVVNRRGGATNVMDSINHMFLMSRMIVPGSTYWNFGVGLEKGDVGNDAEALANMKDLGETIAWLIKRLKA